MSPMVTRKRLSVLGACVVIGVLVLALGLLIGGQISQIQCVVSYGPGAPSIGPALVPCPSGF